MLNTKEDSWSFSVTARRVLSYFALLILAACGPEVGYSSCGLALSPGENGTITASPPGPRYTSGLKVELTAVPKDGYKLESWTGTDDDTSVSPTNTVTMSSDRDVSATFAPQ